MGTNQRAMEDLDPIHGGKKGPQMGRYMGKTCQLQVSSQSHEGLSGPRL